MEETTPTLNDELQYVLNTSKTNKKFMFNEQYTNVIYAKVGNVRSSTIDWDELLRVLYDYPGCPRCYIDIKRDSIVLSISCANDYKDIVFSYDDGEDVLFQQSTIHDLYSFDAETISICKKLAEMFYHYVDTMDRI